jgi:hypothetical protein
MPSFWAAGTWMHVVATVTGEYVAPSTGGIQADTTVYKNGQNIWSSTATSIYGFPARTLIRHSLLLGASNSPVKMNLAELK